VVAKEKLTLQGMIDDMKSKGILFTITSEEEAKEFLEKSNYYFKLKAYCKNYTKRDNGEGKELYYNLEFAYLKELSTIDSLLRKQIIKMTLDIEHFLKVRLLKDIAENDREDGYNIVALLLKNNPTLQAEIIKKGQNSVCAELVKKYQNDFAVWNIAEVLTFGELIELYKLYYALYPTDKTNERVINGLLQVKFLRNAAAHNNCLLNKLSSPYYREISVNQYVNRLVSGIKSISTGTLQKKMKNPVVHDFVVMLFVYQTVCSKKTVYYGMQETLSLFEKRMVKHKDYFSKNSIIETTYKFAYDVVKFFAKNNEL